MNGVNKFQALTIIFICMFIFIVGAIYTNTKEASEEKAKLSNVENPAQQVVQDNNQGLATQYDLDREKLYDLNAEVRELNERVNNLQNSGDSFICSIEGVSDGNNIEQLSPSTALQEARDNGKDLVLVCSLR